MNIELVETFLAVVECRNISTAAQRLFTTQGTVSKRISQLEEELGVPLLIRNKGLRRVELTSYGEKFMPLAQQWMTLCKDFQNIGKEVQRLQLTVGSTETINREGMVRLLRQMQERHPEVQLFLETQHSSELHLRLERHDIDIGFVHSLVNYPDIISTAIYEVPMCLICHRDSNYPEIVSMHRLRAEDEVFERWDTGYEIWHNQFFGSNRYFMRVSNVTMISYFLETPGRWGIVPLNVARTLMQAAPLKYCRIAEEPPRRICYQIEHRYPRPSCLGAVALLKAELERFLSENPDIIRL